MATLVKKVDPDTARPGQSFWDLLLTSADVDDIRAGGAVVLQVTLPISAPDATITLRQAG